MSIGVKSIIERVADAIADADGQGEIATARAAIMAMREPTNEMLKAFYGDVEIDKQLGQDWRDMIDAALK